MSSAVKIEELTRSLYRKTFNKAVCIGKNYSDHAKEMKSDVPKNPMLFDKPFSSIY